MKTSDRLPETMVAMLRSARDHGDPYAHLRGPGGVRDGRAARTRDALLVRRYLTGTGRITEDGAEALRVHLARCPADGARLDSSDDQYICPRCGDEYSIESIEETEAQP